LRKDLFPREGVQEQAFEKFEKKVPRGRKSIPEVRKFRLEKRSGEAYEISSSYAGTATEKSDNI
jgi:hypothetical protein